MAMPGAIKPWSHTNTNTGRPVKPPTGPTRTASEPDWNLAKCRGVDPEIFYPHAGDLAGIEDARAICLSCPIRSGCLEFALGAGFGDGVWGGASEDERRQAKRREARAGLRAKEKAAAE
jgi:WhiB family redox-sensing transcriptional regulator